MGKKNKNKATKGLQKGDVMDTLKTKANYSSIDNKFFLKVYRDMDLVRKQSIRINQLTSFYENKPLRKPKNVKEYVEIILTASISELIELSYRTPTVINEAQLVLGVLNMIRKGYTNIFIDTPELVEFLRTSEVKDHSNIEEFFNIDDEERIEKAHKYTEGDVRFDVERLSFVIHFPQEESSMIVVIERNSADLITKEDKILGHFSITITIGQNTILFVRDDEKGDLVMKDANISDDNGLGVDRLTSNITLLSNIVSYIKCFPDKFINDVGSLNLISPQKINKSFSLRSDPSLISDKFKGSSKPHLRRGHFVTFRADRYTKMKGKTIFVETTFVKGKAKIVIE